RRCNSSDCLQPCSPLPRMERRIRRGCPIHCALLSSPRRISTRCSCPTRRCSSSGSGFLSPRRWGGCLAGGRRTYRTTEPTKRQHRVGTPPCPSPHGREHAITLGAPVG